MQIVLSDSIRYGYKFPTTYWTKYTTFEPAYDLTLSKCAEKYFIMWKSRTDFIEARCKDGIVHVTPRHIRIYNKNNLYELSENYDYYCISVSCSTYFIVNYIHKKNFKITDFTFPSKCGLVTSTSYNSLVSNYYTRGRTDRPFMYVAKYSTSVTLHYKTTIIDSFPIEMYEQLSETARVRPEYSEYLMDCKIEEFVRMRDIHRLKNALVSMFLESVKSRRQRNFKKFKKWCRGSDSCLQMTATEFYRRAAAKKQN